MALVLTMSRGRVIDKKIPAVAAKADVAVNNLHFREIDGDKTRWEVVAEKAFYQKSEEMAYLEKVMVKLELANKRSFTIKGDKGYFNTKTKNVELRGNVQISSSEGEDLMTRKLTYLHQDKSIKTDEPVFLKTTQMEVKGVGMEFFLKSKDLILKSAVKAKIKGQL